MHLKPLTTRFQGTPNNTKPIAEIANAMQKTVKAAEGLLYCGLRQMRQRLGHEGKYFSDARSASGTVGLGAKFL